MQAQASGGQAVGAMHWFGGRFLLKRAVRQSIKNVGERSEVLWQHNKTRLRACMILNRWHAQPPHLPKPDRVVPLPAKPVTAASLRLELGLLQPPAGRR